MDSRRQIKGTKRKPHRIPTELFSEILSRLPARSVIRFRCACKLWRSITNDPYFIDIHLDRARKGSPPSILLFFSNDDWDRYGITIIDHESRQPKRILWGPKTLREDVFFEKELREDVSFGNLYNGVSLGNSCNGLLCICGDDERIKVINPATGDSLTLPEHTKNSLASYLGFHQETKEYKVIRFFPISDETYLLGCEVYTLGTSSWRQIPFSDRYYPYFYSTATVKGAMYWLGQDEESVVSFDLKGENFTRISLPDSKIYIGNLICCHLVELQGCLAVIPNDAKGTSPQMNIWTMTMKIDDPNIVKYEWAVLLSIHGEFAITKPLFIHEEKILVHTTFWGSDSDNPEELVYYPLSRDGQHEEVLYREGKPTSPLIHHYLDGQYEIDEDFFRNCRIHPTRSCVHIESLVPLQRK